MRAFLSIVSGHGHIDSKLLKSADHSLPQGHLNPGQQSDSGRKTPNQKKDKTENKNENSGMKRKESENIFLTNFIFWL